MTSQSVMLTDIGRQQESSISLKKIEERFSRQLIKPKIWDCLHQRILSLASSRVKDKTEITPLHFSLYSQASPDFTGENNQILEAIA